MRNETFVVLVCALGFTASPLCAAAITYEEDFDGQPDGPLAERYQHRPSAQIESGRLALEPDLATTPAPEPQAWAGQKKEPILFDSPQRIACTIAFGDIISAGGIGRHDGLLFCGSRAATRTGEAFSGYSLDWIDRVTDRGLRVHRFDAGVLTPLILGTPDLVDPPSRWEIEFTDTGFDVYGDKDVNPEPVLTTPDTTYRAGFLGFWCFASVDRLMYVDDVTVEFTPEACPTASIRERRGPSNSRARP